MAPESDTLWDEGSDPLALLEYLYPKRTLGSDLYQSRKCRLYLVACARRQWHRLPGACRVLVELAEHVAERPRACERMRAALTPVAEQLMQSDGSEEDLASAGAGLNRALGSVPADLGERLRAAAAGGAAPVPAPPCGVWRGLAALVYLPFAPKTPPFGWVPAELHSADLVREVHYNPHLFAPFPPAWRTPDVLAVARHVYDERAFGDMPVLADALEDAGCDSAEVLGHCRHAPACAHVRGCRVLDLVLRRG